MHPKTVDMRRAKDDHCTTSETSLVIRILPYQFCAESKLVQRDKCTCGSTHKLASTSVNSLPKKDTHETIDVKGEKQNRKSESKLFGLKLKILSRIDSTFLNSLYEEN